MRASVGVCTVKAYSDRIEVDFYVDEESSFCPRSHLLEGRNVHDLTKAYWDFVNSQVGKLSVCADGETAELFFQELVSRAGELAEKLLGTDISERLWSLARSVELLVIRSEVWEVPWESLYYGDLSTGSFLSDNCLIQRVPYDTKKERKRPTNLTEGAGTVIALDPEIAEKWVRQRDGSITIVNNQGSGDVGGAAEKLVDYLIRKHGTVVLTCKQKRVFYNSVSSVKVLHWFCHNGGNGLRLGGSVCFTREDAATYKFESGGVLMIIACKADQAEQDSGSIASQIYLHGNCAVISSPALIEGSCGVALIDRFNEVVKNKDNVSKTVGAIWRLFRNDGWRRELSEGKLSMLSIMPLWFGLYGGSKILLRERGDG